MTTANLGALLVEAGQAVDGRELLLEALNVFQDRGNRAWQARILHNLVEAAYTLKEPAQADEFAQAVVAVLPLEAQGERATVLRRAATAWRDEHPPNIERAEALYEQSLMEQALDETTLAAEAANVAATLSDFGGFEAALHFYTRSLEIYEAVGEQEMAFHIRNDRAIALTSLERFDEARLEYNACLGLAAMLENRAMELQEHLTWAKWRSAKSSLRKLLTVCRTPSSWRRLLTIKTQKSMR